MNCSTCHRVLKPGADKCLYCGATAAGDQPVAAPLRRRILRRIPIRSGGGGAAKLTVGSIVGVMLVCVFIGLRVCRTVERIAGKSVVDETVTIGPGNDYSGGIESSGSHTYTFEVTALDGAAVMAFGKVSDMDKPTSAELMSLLASAIPVARGATQSMAGSVQSGRYVWVVMNRDEKQSARVKIKFHAR